MSTSEAQWQASLTEAAQLWQEIGRDSGALWRGKALGQVLSLTEMDDLEAEFVQESVAECLRGDEEIDAGQPTARLVDVLFVLLARDDPYLGSQAEYALEQIAGTKADVVSSVMERLVVLLDDPDCAVRPRAAGILEEAVRSYPERVTDDIADLLLRLLRDRDSDVCNRAKYILKRVVDARADLAGALAGELETMLADPCDAVRARAACLLEVIVTACPEAATAQMAEALVERFGDSSSDVCCGAQYALEQLVAARPDLGLHVAGLLDDLLDDADAKVRARATRVLERVVQVDHNAATEDRVRALAQLTQERNYEVSVLALCVLWRIADVLPDLVQRVTSQGIRPPAFVTV